MDVIRRLVLVAAAAVAIIVAWRWWFPSEETLIRLTLDRVAAAFTTTGPSADLAQLARVAALSDDIAPDIVVDAGAPMEPLRGRNAVIAAASRLRGSLGATDVRFVDVDVMVDAAGATARVTATAEIRFNRTPGGTPELDARELDVALERRDGRWLVTSATLVKAIRLVT